LEAFFPLFAQTQKSVPKLHCGAVLMWWLRAVPFFANTVAKIATNRNVASEKTSRGALFSLDKSQIMLYNKGIIRLLWGTVV
jgi:hypothetical protein